MQTIISILGLISFASIFIGTAISILFFSWAVAGKVAIVSLIMFLFFVIITNIFER